MPNKTLPLAAVIALAALSSLASAANVDSGVPLLLNNWAGGFVPAMMFSFNFLWCSNQPTGSTCADLMRTCNRVSSVPYGRDYWAYYELYYPVHNGNYDYFLQASETSPSGYYQEALEVKGRVSGTASGSLCNWIHYHGDPLAKPAGKWWYSLEAWDALNNYVKADTGATFNVSCSADSECAAGLGCLAGVCTKAPDLTVTDLRVCPAQPIANLTTEFFGYVKNIGYGDVPASPWVRNEFYADGHNFDHDFIYDGLAVGQEKSSTTHTTLSDGGHAIDLKTDVGNVVPETNERNNELRKVWGWLSAKPDFIISSLDISPSPPIGSEAAEISVTVKEAHGWEVLEAISVNVSVDGVPLPIQTAFIIPVAGITLNYWLLKPPGTHEVRVAVDSFNAVAEENEANNLVTQQVAWLQPVEYSQSLGGVAGEYHVGDVIKAVFSAREKIGTPLAGATVTVRDSFGGSASLTTDSLGLAYYQFNASRSGLHFLEFRTSKGSYATYWQKQSFKVIDWNARVHVTVHDRWGNPVYKAGVARGNVTRGTTARDGTLEFLTDKGYNDVRVYCPDRTPCQSWLPYVENTTFLDVTCDCKSDSDGDGLSDELEDLSCSNLNDNSSNIFSVLKRASVPIGGCLRVPSIGTLLGLSDFQKQALLEQAASLDASSVQALSEGNDTVLKRVLFAAGINESQFRPDRIALIDGFRNSTRVMVVQGRAGVFIGMDLPGGNFWWSWTSPTCVGVILGIYRGAGFGLQSDVDTPRAITDAFGYIGSKLGELPSFITHLGEIMSFFGQVFSALGGLPTGISDVINAFVRQALVAGKGEAEVLHSPYLQSPDDCPQYQAGFVGGYVAGFAIEQGVSQIVVAIVTEGIGLSAAVGKLAALLVAKGGAVMSIGKGFVTVLGFIVEHYGGAAAKIISESKLAAASIELLSDAGRAGMGLAAQSVKSGPELDALILKVEQLGVTKEAFFSSLSQISDDLVAGSKLGRSSADAAVARIAKSQVGVELVAAWQGNPVARLGLGKVYAVAETDAKLAELELETKRIVAGFGKDNLELAYEAAGRGYYQPGYVRPMKAAEVLDVGNRARVGNVFIRDGKDRVVQLFKNERTSGGITIGPSKSARVDRITSLKIGEGGESGFGWTHIDEEHMCELPRKKGDTTFPQTYGVRDPDVVKSYIQDTILNGKETYVGEYKYSYEFTPKGQTTPMRVIVSKDPAYELGTVITAYPLG